MNARSDLDDLEPPIQWAVIDTIEPAAYHISYVATDGTGKTATRTVIVRSPSIVPDDGPMGQQETATSTT